MDSKLEAYLTGVIPKLAGSSMRDARRSMGKLWNEGREAPETYTPAFELDDIKQEMWLTAVAHEQALIDHLTAGNEAAISTVLKRAANQMVTAEKREIRAKRAALAGYETYDEVFYTVGSLRRLLPMYLDALDDDGLIPERPPAGREQPGKVSGSSESYGDYLATMIDVHRAFVALTEAKQKILERYFSYPQGSGGWTHTEIASAMGMPPNELSPRIHHALSALQRELGGQSPWNKGPAPGRGRK